MAYTPLNERPLAFIDTETTGLDPRVHEVIEVAIVKEWPDGKLEEWSTKVAPQNLKVATEIALKVNGYNDHPELWEGAPKFDDIAPLVAAKLDDCVLVGHNVSFDLDFLNEALKRAGSPAKLPYHKVDTVTLAYAYLVPKGLKSLSLDNIRRFFGWSHEGAHTALVDAHDARRLYREIVGR